MQTNPTKTAQHFYALYETLPTDTQQAFLTEILQKQSKQLEDLAFYLACKAAKDENAFLSEAETQVFIKESLKHGLLRNTSRVRYNQL